jgi:hypothetical protein
MDEHWVSIARTPKATFPKSTEVRRREGFVMLAGMLEVCAFPDSVDTRSSHDGTTSSPESARSTSGHASPASPHSTSGPVSASWTLAVGPG